MTPGQLNALGEIADSADNFLEAASNLPLQPEMHVQQLALGIADIRDRIRAIVADVKPMTEGHVLDEQELKNDPVYGKSYNDLVREIIHLRSQRNDARSLAESCIPLAVQYNAMATERVLRKAVDEWGKE